MNPTESPLVKTLTETEEVSIDIFPECDLPRYSRNDVSSPINKVTRCGIKVKGRENFMCIYGQAKFEECKEQMEYFNRMLS